MAANRIPKGFSFFAPAFSRLLPEEKRKILSLKVFNDETAQQDFLGQDQQEELVKQAVVLLDQLYAHQFQKRTLYAVNPLERLAALRSRLPLETRKFHEEMLSVFMELRDRHTNYILPQKYRWSAAFLPFLIEELYDDQFPIAELRNDENRYYMISKICTREPYIKQSLVDDLKAEGLLQEQAGALVPAPGVIITHWNSMPINRAVELNADFFAGSNEAAHHARSLQNMTVRLLFNVLPPEEEEGVTVEYYNLNTGRSGEFKFEWQVWESDPPMGVLESEIDSGAELVHRETALGIDSDSELVRRVKRALFQKDDEAAEPTLMPDVFRWKLLELDGGVKLGYIRIWTFDASYAAILWEFTRIVQRFPQDTQGMIIDVRGNSGGSIPAAVLLLQLLSPGLIKSQYFQFVSTPLTLELCRRTRASLSKIRQAKQAEWEKWEDDAHCAVERMWETWESTIKNAAVTGTMFSEQIPLVPAEALQYVQQIDPNLGQHYGNRVLLIADALSYSAAEMFAAGFHDNNIGPILGTDGLTGGGGADVWFHHQLGARFAGGDGDDGGDGGLDDLIATLPTQAPAGPTFTVALRQSIRPGAGVPIPLEDYGVIPGVIHKMTRDDLLAGNYALLEQMAPEILLKSFTNRDIANAFSAAARGLFAQEKCAALATTAGVTIIESDDLYSGPQIDQLPNLSPEEKRAIEAELPYINQDIYTTFKLAAADLGISYHWKWMAGAGVGSYNEMSATSNSRSAPYAGKPIDELELLPNEKAKIKEKLSVVVASRTAPPAYRNKDVKKAFEQAAGNLVQWNLMIQAQLKVSDLIAAPQMLYRGAEIDQLPNLTDDQKGFIKRWLPGEKKILPRMPSNGEVIDVFSQVGKELGKELKPPTSALVNARQAVYIGPGIDQISTLSDTEKETIKKELQWLMT